MTLNFKHIYKSTFFNCSNQFKAFQATSVSKFKKIKIPIAEDYIRVFLIPVWEIKTIWNWDMPSSSPDQTTGNINEKPQWETELTV